MHSPANVIFSLPIFGYSLNVNSFFEERYLEPDVALLDSAGMASGGGGGTGSSSPGSPEPARPLAAIGAIGAPPGSGSLGTSPGTGDDLGELGLGATLETLRITSQKVGLAGLH